MAAMWVSVAVCLCVRVCVLARRRVSGRPRSRGTQTRSPPIMRPCAVGCTVRVAGLFHGMPVRSKRAHGATQRATEVAKVRRPPARVRGRGRTQAGRAQIRAHCEAYKLANPRMVISLAVVRGGTRQEHTYPAVADRRVCARAGLRAPLSGVCVCVCIVARARACVCVCVCVFVCVCVCACGCVVCCLRDGRCVRQPTCVFARPCIVGIVVIDCCRKLLRAALGPRCFPRWLVSHVP